MPIDRYVNLDLGSDGAAARDLFARADREAGSAGINLTGDGDDGALSPNLTPAMSGWLAAQIARPRAEALNMIADAAKRLRLKGGVEGIVRDFEHDQLRRDRARKHKEARSLFYENHRETLDSFGDADNDYAVLRSELGGRDALLPSKWIVYGIPALIMIPEFFMNYNSFLKLADVPAIAVGLSLVVALAVAVSSYMTGVFWKAYHYFMHPDDEVQRAKGWRMAGVASFLLTTSLAAVGYARFQSVMEQVRAAEIIGSEPPNAVALTSGLLAGNVIVWAIGAAITYLKHDEHPEYARKAEARDKAQKLVEQVRQRDLIGRINNIEAAHREDAKRLDAKAAQMRVLPEYADIGRDAGRVAAKDAEVLGLLKDYRTLLVDRICRRDPAFVFHGPPTDRHSGASTEAITPSEFAARDLHLYRTV